MTRKLGIRPGDRVEFVDAPPGWRWAAGEGGEPRDVVVAFFRSASGLRAEASRLGNRIFPHGMLWIAWPRKAAGHQSDLTENLIRDVVLPLGLVDTKVAALGEDWSGLRVVWRKELRG